MTLVPPIILGTPETLTPRFRTVMAALRHHALSQPDRVVFQDDEAGCSLTFGELHLAATKAAVALFRRAPAGSRVALTASPGLNAAITYCGIAYAGMSPVLLPTPESADDVASFAHIVRDLRDRVSVAFALDVTRHRLSAAAERECWYGDLETLTMRDLAETSGGAWEPTVGTGRDVAHWLFSSGTTGPAKAIRVSQGAVAFNCEYTARMWGFEAGDCMVCSGAPHHSAGLMTGYLMPIYVGASAILLSPSRLVRSPHHLPAAISKSRATHLACPDSLIARLLLSSEEGFAALDLSSWRSAIIGGEPLTRDVLTGFANWLRRRGAGHVGIGTAFGMSEAAGLITTTGLRLPRAGTFDIAALGWGEAVATSRSPCRFIAAGGVPAYGVRVAVVDPDNAPLPAGRLGRVVFSSPSLFDGYEGHGEPASITLASTDGDPSGFFETGDIGFLMSGEGDPQLAIVGRAKEAISTRDAIYHGVDLEHVAASLLPGAPITRIVATADPDTVDGVLIVAEMVEALTAEETSRRIGAAFAELLPSPPVRVVVIPPATLPSMPTTSKKPRARVLESFRAGQLKVLATCTSGGSRCPRPSAISVSEVQS